MIEPLPPSDTSRADVHTGSGPGRAGHWLMMVCCLAMVAGVGIVVIGSWRASGTVDWAGAVLPLLACVGAHLLMMGVWGRSCHSTARKDVARVGDDRSPSASSEVTSSAPEPSALVGDPR